MWPRSLGCPGSQPVCFPGGYCSSQLHASWASPGHCWLGHWLSLFRTAVAPVPPWGMVFCWTTPRLFPQAFLNLVSGLILFLPLFFLHSGVHLHHPLDYHHQQQGLFSRECFKSPECFHLLLLRCPMPRASEVAAWLPWGTVGKAQHMTISSEVNSAAGSYPHFSLLSSSIAIDFQSPHSLLLSVMLGILLSTRRGAGSSWRQFTAWLQSQGLSWAVRIRVLLLNKAIQGRADFL